MIIGHLATAVLLKQYLPEEEMRPLFVGSIFPDVGDKLIKYLQLNTQGRSIFHSLLGLFATAAILGLFSRKEIVRGWLLGYAFHLICDTGGTVPWFYPFVDYEPEYSPYSYQEKIFQAFTKPRLVEWMLIGWAIFKSIRS